MSSVPALDMDPQKGNSVLREKNPTFMAAG